MNLRDLVKKRGEMTNIIQETGWYDNTGNPYSDK
jgi:hypothetical protein